MESRWDQSEKEIITKIHGGGLEEGGQKTAPKIKVNTGKSRPKLCKHQKNRSDPRSTIWGSFKKTAWWLKETAQCLKRSQQEPDNLGSDPQKS